MRVALFTQNFLEPTHYAIAQVLAGLDQNQYYVYAKRFMDKDFFTIPNIYKRTIYTDPDAANIDLCKPDIIHAIYDGTTAFRAAHLAKQAGIPFLLSFHGGFDTNAKIHDERYKLPTRMITEQAEVVTVVGESDVNRLKQIGVKKKIKIVPVPIDLKMIPKNESKRDKNSLCIIGRLIPKKGIDTSLKILAALPGSYYLNVIGDGPQALYLKQLAVSLKINHRVN